MTGEQASARIVDLWLSKAGRALEAARDELAAGRDDFAINRAYYACFYALSALLLKEGQRFVKHSGVRAALHQHVIKPGRLDPAWGVFYDDIFRARHEADYGEVESPDVDRVQSAIDEADRFVGEMRGLMGAGP